MGANEVVLLHESGGFAGPVKRYGTALVNLPEQHRALIAGLQEGRATPRSRAALLIVRGVDAIELDVSAVDPALLAALFAALRAFPLREM